MREKGRERGRERDKEEEDKEEEDEEEEDEEEEEEKEEELEGEDKGGGGGRTGGGGRGKSFLAFINAMHFWHRSFMFPFMFWESNDYHFTFSLADFCVQSVFMNKLSEMEFLLNGTKANYIKIPPSNLNRGWYRTLTIFHFTKDM